MVDAHRSWNMSRIRGSDTQPELRVRRALSDRGIRYRLHLPELPGRPDVAITARRVAVFVHGCFWHRHARCRFAYTPKTNIAFWASKFSSNVERDRRKARELRAAGWRVAIIWECQTKDSKRLSTAVDRVIGAPPARPGKRD